MLNPEQLKLAIDVHARCYKLLKWISAAIADGRIPVRNASRHSDDPSAALEWIESIYPRLPDDMKPDQEHLEEFANYFWTYLTTSFDMIEEPGILMSPGDCGCPCGWCVRITRAPHLQPKKLYRSDKQRAKDLMIDRVLALAAEHKIEVSQLDAQEVVVNESTRRSAGYSTYGHWLIQRLDGYSDGPAVLALWREIAWNRKGSPIHGFQLLADDFVDAENAILKSLGLVAR